MKFHDLTARRAQLHPERTALVDPATARHVTYAQLDDRANRIAHALAREWGVGPGDRVAMLAHNRIDTFELLFACAKLEAVLVPLNWRLAVPELTSIVRDAEPVGLVCDDAFAEPAAALRDQFGLHGWAFGDQPLDTEAAFEHIVATADATPIIHEPRDEDELWYLLYTSGTTGRPKGVLNTFGMAIVNYLNIGLACELTAHDTFVAVLPQFHTGGINLHALPMLLVGGTVVVPRTFDANEVLGLLGDGATAFFGVPTIYQMLAEHPDFATTDLSGVRSWAAGGAPMPVPLLERLGEVGIGVQQGMGMTETGPTVFLLDEEHAISKAGSVGMPQTFVDVRIVDRDGLDVADGEQGELLIRGAGVTPGYWRLPEATDRAFDPDGWLYSGDVARRDADGFYYIVDRVKDMYISGGENVYPAEVEQVIYRFEGVAAAAVIGVGDRRWGEVGKAFVVPVDGARIDADELRAHCRDHLATYKVPAHVEVVDELPRNATGKVQKHVLEAQEQDPDDRTTATGGPA